MGKPAESDEVKDGDTAGRAESSSEIEDLEVEVEDDGAEGEAEASSSEEGDGGGDEVSVLEALEKKVAELEAEKKDHYERLLRATADLDNFRKRSRREIQDARVDARARTLREILPVIDNLERAMAHAESAEDGSAKGVIDGVRLVIRQFSQALEKCDAKIVEAKGKAFDPNVHEAMSQIETADVPPGSVVEVLQTGYVIGERLLRPALVVVAKAPPEPAAGANGKSATAEDDSSDEAPSDEVAESEETNEDSGESDNDESSADDESKSS